MKRLNVDYRLCSMNPWMERCTVPTASSSIGYASPCTCIKQRRWVSVQSVMCYSGKATKAWHRQGRQKHNTIKNSYSQPKRPSTAGTTHRSSTGLHSVMYQYACMAAQWCNSMPVRLCSSSSTEPAVLRGAASQSEARQHYGWLPYSRDHTSNQRLSSLMWWWEFLCSWGCRSQPSSCRLQAGAVIVYRRVALDE